MRCELPDFRRCCCFIPLRYGIITFGYLNLVFTILLIAFELWVGLDSHPVEAVSVVNYRGVSMFVQMWFVYCLYGLEVVFDIILLVGAHTKRPHLMRMYFYYGVLTTVATFLSFVVLRIDHGEQHWYWTSFEYCFAFSGFVLQVYLLLLIRTELKKLKEKQRGQSYDNQMAEVVLDQPPFGDGRSYL